MSLLDEAQAALTKGPQCSVATAKEQHATLAPEIDELIDAVRARKVYGNTAGRILQAHGIAVKGETVLRHANRECSCR